MLSLYMFVGGFDGVHRQNGSENGCCGGVKHFEAANGREACKDCETNYLYEKLFLFLVK